MLRLNYDGILNYEAWTERNIKLPQFNINEAIKNTKENPTWIHFGAGNIFRSFPALLQQKLLEQGKEHTGIIVAEGYDYEIIDKMNKPHDNLSLLVTLKADGQIEKTVVASVVEALKADSQNEKDFERLKEIFKADSLQMVSFTITEKGYSINDKNGNLITDVEDDFISGPNYPKSYIGKISALCYERYLSGKKPIALVSMDNCSHNGTKLYNAINSFAKAWTKNKLVEEGFYNYINDKGLVSFPWSMIDKITPRPDDNVKESLIQDGIENVDPIITTKNTYAALFINAEESEYLVIEDAFPNGRPKLDEVGVKFTDRATVDRVEKMKVCTCLNPLHTALAIYGCLLSHTKIYQEMNDKELRLLIENIGYKEGLPVVVDPEIIKPKDFIDEVLNVRLPNPFMPDTPQRIATDTSQKLGIRFGETIKSYIKHDSLNVKDLTFIPLVIAGWCRYLLGINDEGKEFILSSDPMLETLREYVKDIKIGDKGPFSKELHPILSNENTFGINLYEAGIGEMIESYFEELVRCNGAVRITLIKYLN